MTGSEPVAYHVAHGVAHVELNRPAAFNALDIPLAHGLLEAIGEAAADDDVKAVLLSGRGRAFCAGGDVKMMAGAEDVAGAVHDVATAAHRAILALSRLPKPVVAAVHGAVAGGGVGLACAADLILAGATTKFVAAYPGIAVTPDCGLTWALPRIIGERRALQFMLLNQPITAAKAEEWGLVAGVLEDDGVQAAGLALARTLASGPGAAALGRTRRLVRDSASTELSAHLDAEAASISQFAGSPTSTKLIQAFANR